MIILHIINSLEMGGAERNLYQICVNDKKNKHIVISLTGSGHFSEAFKKRKIRVYEINIKKNLFLIFKIVKIINTSKPSVIQTWMYNSDFVGSISSILALKTNLVWGIRHTNLIPAFEKKRTLIISKILAYLSYFITKKIIVCSSRAMQEHIKLGYNKKKMIYIPNGCDLDIFYPLTHNRKKILSELKIDESIPLLGSIGRYNFYKDFNNLFEALNIVKKKNILFNFLLVGKDNNKSNQQLAKLINQNGLGNRVYLMGLRNDVSKILNSLDLFILSSRSEAFPNVVMEAMACGTPCVVTDVGDASYIVEKTGWIVPPKNPIELAKKIEIAINELKSPNWQSIRASANLRIREKFTLETMINSYTKIWDKIKSE